jgi:hypothetical protein
MQVMSALLQLVATAVQARQEQEAGGAMLSADDGGAAGAADSSGVQVPQSLLPPALLPQAGAGVTPHHCTQDPHMLVPDLTSE